MTITTLENDPQVIKAFSPMGRTSNLIQVHITPETWAVYLHTAFGYPPPPRDFNPWGTVRAQISHSRWVVKCPFCMGALPASKADPRFWCSECGMTKNGGRPLRIVYPAEVATIEKILLMRPDHTQRNWRPDETVADLARENLAHKSELRF